MKKTLNGIIYSSLAIGLNGKVEVRSYNPLTKRWVLEWTGVIYGENSIHDIEYAGMYEFINLIL